MMSSATQTEESVGARAADAPGAGDALSPWLVRGLGVLILLGGWMAIGHVYHWHFGPPVFFLGLGWLALLLTVRYLWQAGLAAASDTGAPEDDFWRPMGQRDELLREKRILLKAIKEIEFDHQMGKTSDEDAAELARFYRLRAIEIIKALEGGGDGGQVSVQEQIEREVKARLAVAEAKDKAAPGSAATSASADAEATATAVVSDAAEPGDDPSEAAALGGASGSSAGAGKGKTQRGRKQNQKQKKNKARAEVSS